MIKKKILVTFVAMTMPLLAMADYSGKCGDNVMYDYNSSTRTLTISGTGEMYTYTYDNSGGSTAPWNNYRNNISSLKISDGVSSISSWAFYGCSSLSSITIPNTIRIIGGSAFAQTSWYNKQPDGLLYIGKVLYDYKGSMPSNTSVVIKEGTVSISASAFIHCGGLTSVTLPNSVTDIGYMAFYECTGLSSVSLGSGVINIDKFAFGSCGNLTSIIIPKSVKSIGDVAFEGCSKLTSLEIPNSVTSIGYNAFRRCTNLTSVSIGTNLKVFDGCVFCDCPNLTHIDIDKDNPFFSSLDGIVFNKDKTRIVSYPAGKVETTFAIPSSVKDIDNGAFWSCSKLYNITIPDNVKTIGDYSFMDCSNLTSVIIPEGVTTIGQAAFASCTSLTSITLPSSVTSIGGECFVNYQLESVFSLIEEPFEIYGKYTELDVFDWGTFDNATLYVPKGTLDKYKNTVGWKDFLKIEEMETSISMPKHTLSYILDGEVYKSYQVEEGDVITPETAPTKEGYTFSGWSEIPEIMPAHDVTVTGTFTTNKYKLTYMVDGEEYKSYEIEYGKKITPEPEPTKEGYTFSGWSYIPSKMPAENVMVVGTFTVNKYQVTYIIDGEVFLTEDVEYGAKIIPPEVPVRNGYVFAWSDIPIIMPAENITITGTYTTRINRVIADVQERTVFTLNGQRTDKLKKGINIIWLKNGKTLKIAVN